jgi:hypothetical protein
MNRVAAFQTAICSLAVGALSTGTSTFVVAASQGHLGMVSGLAGCAALAVGTWLVHVGHCRGMLPGSVKG